MENTPDVSQLVDVNPDELVDVPQEQLPEASALVDEPDINASQARKMGFAEGLTFSNAAEIAAIPQTTKDVFEAIAESYAKDGLMGTVNVFPSILETHRQNTRIEQQTLDKLSSKYPFQYAASELAGGLLSEAAVLSVPTMLGVPPTLSGMLTAHFGVNFAHGLGKADKQTLGENIAEAIEAGGIGAGLPLYAQKGVQTIARVGTGVGKKTAQTLMDKGIIDQKKFVKQGMLKFLGLGEESVGLTAEQFGKETDDLLYRVAAYTGPDGAPLIDFRDTRIETLKKFSAARKVEGDSMGDMLASLGEGYDKDPVQIFNYIDDTIFQGTQGRLNRGDVNEKQVAERVRTNLKALFFKKNPETGLYDTDFPNEKFGPYLMHDYMQSAYKQARHHAKSVMKGTAVDPIEGNFYTTKKQIADMLWDDLDGMLRNTDIYDDYVSTKMRFGDLKLIEDQLRDTIRPDKGKGAGFINKLVKDRLASTSSSLALITGAVGGAASNNKPLMYASAAALGLQAIYENPRVNGFLATTARNVADELKRNPDKYNKMAGMFISLANRGDGTPLIDHLGLMASTIELNNRPLQRTTEDLIQKQDAVLTLLHDMDPKVAGELKDAINLGDTQTIAGIMSAISPKAPKGTLAEGIGWDGRAITPEDKAAVMGKLKQLDPRKRAFLIPDFEATGIIPQEFYNPVNPKVNNVMEHVKKQRQNGIKRPEF